MHGSRKELRCGGSQLTAYSRQQRAAESRFQQTREEELARIALMPALPELLAEICELLHPLVRLHSCICRTRVAGLKPYKACNQNQNKKGVNIRKKVVFESQRFW